MKARSALLYSVLRLLAFLVPFGILMLFPIFQQLYWLAAIFAALIGLSLSLLFLRRPLSDATAGLAERRAARDADARGAAADAEAEDDAADALGAGTMGGGAASPNAASADERRAATPVEPADTDAGTNTGTDAAESGATGSDSAQPRDDSEGRA